MPPIKMVNENGVKIHLFEFHLLAPINKDCAIGKRVRYSIAFQFKNKTRSTNFIFRQTVVMASYYQVSF